MRGIRRVRAGSSFRYLDAQGKSVVAKKELARIKALAIPPAWTKVWICADPQGHLQATGRDARGRKQFRYHPRWRSVRDETKYERLISFGKALPMIRKKIHADMARPGLPRKKVLATIVRLLETTLIRVGNEEYARNNSSFGLTTMRDRHVEVNGGELRFEFRGKSGKQHEVTVRDRRLARIVGRCQDLPGQKLFQYLDAKQQRRSVDSADVNAYLHNITGQDFTAKDFRTWAGTVIAAAALLELKFHSQARAKRNVLAAIEAVAKRLGNTKAVCRKCYIHPQITDAYLDGSLVQAPQQKVKRRLTRSPQHLSPEEAAVLAFLQRRLNDERADRP
jgi:DNA topoisomerase-1